MTEIKYHSQYELRKAFNEIYDKNYINQILDRFNYKNNDTREKIKNIKLISSEYLKNNIK